MKYRSTRGGCQGLSFKDSLCVGWSGDGGLLMPESVPLLTKEKLCSFSTLTYREICLEIFEIFAGDEFVKTYSLDALLTQSHSSFPNDVVPLKRITDTEYVHELFHGPTHSFKDVPLSVAGPLLNQVLKHEKKHGIIYVATSGDTGSAVNNSLKNSSNADVITLFPGGNRISELQRLLMTALHSDNIHNFSGDCFCDDFDACLVKFPGRFAKLYPDVVVTSLNSLTWVRIMMQVCHVVYAYSQVAQNLEEVTIVIPTGGGGHTTSALVASQLGLPIKVMCAFNENNLNLFNFLSGKELVLNLPTTPSKSCAMDIQMPPNLERWIYLLTDGDVKEVKRYMKSLYETGSMKASEQLLQKLQGRVTTFTSNDNEIINTMKKCWEEFNYVIDPHTACGFQHHYTKTEASTPIVYMGCASPMKFTDDLKEAQIPIPEEYENYFNDLKNKNEKFSHLPENQEDWIEFFITYINEKIAHKFNH